MDVFYYSRTMGLLAGLVFLIGCSAPRANLNPAGGRSKVFKGEPPPWRFFLTITPEQIEAARSAPECRPADNDSDGHWGMPWEGIQLSIRLQKKVFTNGEPIMASITLRNVSDRVRYFWISKPRPEIDTKMVLLRGQERLSIRNDAQPGLSFQQRLKTVWVGKFYQEQLMPGTQRQFLRNLSEMFDLTVLGSYSAHAEQWEVVALERLPERPGYLKGVSTNLMSGTVVFQVVGSGH
jgi:hypothetical protein